MALDGYKVCPIPSVLSLPTTTLPVASELGCCEPWAAASAAAAYRGMDGRTRWVRVPYSQAPTRRVGRTQGVPALACRVVTGWRRGACGAGGYQPPGDGPHHPRARADLPVAAHHGAHVRRVTAALPPLHAHTRCSLVGRPRATRRGARPHAALGNSRRPREGTCAVAAGGGAGDDDHDGAGV